MLTAFLTGSGSQVLIPDAVAVVDGATYDEVNFVDAAGRTLVVFKRADLSLYAEDGSRNSLPEALSDPPHEA